MRAKEESESELVNEIGERSKRVTAIAAAVQLECDQHIEDGGEKRLFKRKTKNVTLLILLWIRYIQADTVCIPTSFSVERSVRNILVEETRAWAVSSLGLKGEFISVW